MSYEHDEVQTLQQFFCRMFQHGLEARKNNAHHTLTIARAKFLICLSGLSKIMSNSNAPNCALKKNLLRKSDSIFNYDERMEYNAANIQDTISCASHTIFFGTRVGRNIKIKILGCEERE